MASFIGTKEEFKRYIGPMLRNLVQQLTKKHKIEVGRCEHCGISENLEAAHKHGKDRCSLIDTILNNHTNNNIVTIDLSSFEQCFRDEHKKIDDTILILCKACHSAYDSSLKMNNEFDLKYPISTKNNPENIQETWEKYEGQKTDKRIFTNKEIQRRISAAAQKLSTIELEKLCSPQYSKETFNINFPLFVKIPKNISTNSKDKILKDHKGRSRWTLKYIFEKEGFLYAITTQWYKNNDIYVKIHSI